MNDELTLTTPCPLGPVFGEAEIGPHDMRPSLRVWAGIWRLDASRTISVSDDLVILLVHLSGAPMALEIAGNEKREHLTAGSIAALTCGTTSQLIVNGDAAVLALTFDEALLRMSAIPNMARAPGVCELCPGTMPPPNAVWKLAEILAAEISSDAQCRAACRASLILSIVEYIAAEPTFSQRSDKASPVHEDCIRRVLRLIDENISLELTIGNLAQAVGVSPYVLSRSFRGEMGLGLPEYIRKRRTNAACKFLAETHKPLIEIAYDCGFSSQSRMNNVFRSELDMTPLEFRKSRSQGDGRCS